MRLFSILSLIVFSLFVLMIHGQTYKPHRKDNLSYDQAVDSRPFKCQAACKKACPANCHPKSLCEEQDAGYVYSGICVECICPVPFPQ
jgi:hypothetical protein